MSHPSPGKSTVQQIRETLQQTDAIHRVAEDAEREVRIGALSPVLGAQAIVRALRVSGMTGLGRAEEQASCAGAAIDCGVIDIRRRITR